MSRYLVENDEPRNRPDIAHVVDISEDVGGRKYGRKVWLTAEDDVWNYGDWVSSVAAFVYPNTDRPIIDGLSWLITSACGATVMSWALSAVSLALPTLAMMAIAGLTLAGFIVWMLVKALDPPVVAYRVLLVLIGVLIAL